MAKLDNTSWDSIRVLLAVDEEGSLRQAARRVGLSQPTLSRRLRELETQLGHALMIRHARGVSFTTEGLAVLEMARGVQDRMNELQRGLDGRRQEIAGRVRISCTEAVAMEVLPPTLDRLREEHPGLYVDLVADSQASDLDRREADLAIRMFQPTRPSLVARKVGEAYTAFYASQSYIDRHGRPTTFDDLQNHAVIGPDRSPVFVEVVRQMGFDPETLAYRTDNLATMHAWVRAGLALGGLLSTVANPDPSLVQVLPPINRYPVWLVSHPDLFGSAAVRAVWEKFAADLPHAFAQDPAE